MGIVALLLVLLLVLVVLLGDGDGGSGFGVVPVVLFEEVLLVYLVGN